MKKIIVLVLCLLLSAAVLVGCNQEEAPYTPTGDALDDLRPTLPTEPNTPQQIGMCYYPDKTMNPYTCTEPTNRALMMLIYQGLFSVDRDYNVYPILCGGYTVSADMRTYTFTVTEARFSDGTSVTGADVLASLEAARAGSYYAGRFQHVKSMELLVSGAVEIKLDTPYSDLPLLLDIPIVKGSEVNSDMPLGTGPFQMEDSVGGKRLRKQTFWWSNATLPVTAQYIPLTAASTPSQIRDQFEFSDVSLVLTDPGSDTYADYRCDYEIWDAENGMFLYLVCNAKSKVFSNDTIRKNLTHAIDRDTLVDTYYRGFARAALLPASPLSPFYNSALASRYGYDPQKLTDALTDAGKQGSEVILLLNSDDSLRLRAGRAIAGMLRKCGLAVTVMELNSLQFKEQIITGEYDLYLGQTRLSPNMDLTAFFKEKGSLNYGGLSNTAAYALSLESLANSGNYYNLHEYVMENGQLCPVLMRSYAVYTTRGLFSDLNPARDNIFFYTLGKTLADIKQKA